MKQAESVIVPVTVPVTVSPWFRNGTLGWMLIGTGVLVWDLVAPETLSDAFRRAHQHPASKVAVISAWAMLTLHLFNKLPSRVDPLHGVTIVRTHFRHPVMSCCTDPWNEE